MGTLNMALRIVLILALAGCVPRARADTLPNTLSDREKQAGWQLIFDGKTTKGWMTIAGQPLPDRHVQKDGLNPHPCDYMLVYERPLENYMLALDFKITPKCNSGIFVRTMPLTQVKGRDVGYNG